MYITKDSTIQADSFRDFQDQVLVAYRDKAEANEVSVIQYDEVDAFGGVVSSGSVCVEPGCNCQGSW